MGLSYEDVIKYITTCLTILESHIDHESMQQIKHYLAHDEYEMAFEMLFLEMMHTTYVPTIDLDKGKNIAFFLKLDQESVFDDQFWKKFIRFVKSNSNHQI